MMNPALDAPAVTTKLDYGNNNQPQQQDREAVIASMAKRRIPIPSMSHSTKSSEAIPTQRVFGSNYNAPSPSAPPPAASSVTPIKDPMSLAYGLPSSDNGQPLQDTSTDDDRKGMPGGLRATLTSKLTSRRKTKGADDLDRAATMTRRQHHHFESFKALTGQQSQSPQQQQQPQPQPQPQPQQPHQQQNPQKKSQGPTFEGKPVGQPMAFQHLEHMSRDQAAPKMEKMNQQSRTIQPKASTFSNRSNESKKSLPFLNLRPAVSLLSKSSSKQSLPRNLTVGVGNGNKGNGPPTVRGMPIGAPMAFQHVEHMSPDEYSMQQYQLMNHKQQQQEIMSSLTSQPSSYGTTKGSGHKKSMSSLADRFDRMPPKVTLQGLPLSGPISFEHVEHISPKEYKARVGDAMATAAISSDHQSLYPTNSRRKFSGASVGSSHSAGHRYRNAKAAAAGSSASKIKEISTPFNVKHDVHIRAEDLDEFMQQAPDNMKPYISPSTRSPRSSIHHQHQQQQHYYKQPANGAAPAAIGKASMSVDNISGTPSSPHTPIYEEMTSSRRRGSTAGESQLADQMARTGLNNEANGFLLSHGADSSFAGNLSDWLPPIVSVMSPTDNDSLDFQRKPQTSACHSETMVNEVRKASRFPSTEQLPNGMLEQKEKVEEEDKREPTTSSVPSSPTNPNTTDNGDAPDSPLSATAIMGPESYKSQIIMSTKDKLEANSRKYQPQLVDISKVPMPPIPNSEQQHFYQQQPHTQQQKQRQSAMVANKWIKRKSRMMPPTRFSMAATGGPRIMSPNPEEKEEEEGEVRKPSVKNDNTLLLHEDDEELAEKPSTRHHDRKSSKSSSSKSSKRRRENYGELEEYAEGESGNVYITTWKTTAAGKKPKGDYVAVKVVSKAAKARYRKLRTELKILRRIRSQHVVRFYEYFSIDDSVWIVYEFMSRGCITDLLAGYPEVCMPAVTISYAMHEVLTALAYLHERHIIHCDVRSDNVLIDQNGQVKLADFSSAVYLDADQPSVQKATLGAIYWMAPELAKGSGYAPSTDVWAAGALLYEMLEGQPPYIEYPDIKVLELASTNGMPKLGASAPEMFGDTGLVELMELCTAISPSDRPAASRLRKHESVVSPNTAQCAQLMADFVQQVESLAGEYDDDGDGDDDERDSGILEAASGGIDE